MDLVVTITGLVRALYDEALDLTVLGQPAITRASHVEPDRDGRWWADLRPVNGPILGPFVQRSAALEAEHDWLTRHWLTVER